VIAAPKAAARAIKAKARRVHGTLAPRIVKTSSRKR
jgi:hypothetical protein